MADVKLELLKASGDRSARRSGTRSASAAAGAGTVAGPLAASRQRRRSRTISRPVPTGPPPPPPIPLKFIGVIDERADAPRVAVLSDGRGTVVYGKEGDILEGRYRVLRIGADSAELAYLDGRGRQTIRLSGQ